MSDEANLDAYLRRINYAGSIAPTLETLQAVHRLHVSTIPFENLDPLAAFATLESVNDVPAVPVVRNKTHHIALVPQSGNVPQLPPELRDMLRYPPEVLSLSPAPSLVW